MNVQRIPVLMYHQVGVAQDAHEGRYCVSPRRFAAHMHALARAGWRAIALHEFFAWLDKEVDIPADALLLTFDDGLLGVYEYAAPILAGMQWPATVFLVSGLIGKTSAWQARHPAGAITYPLMSADHIRDLRGQRFSFHSHTRSHADLVALDDAGLSNELRGSRADLEALLGEAVDCLAYPYGRYDERVSAAARNAGYRAAFSVQPGFNARDADRFRLRRLDVYATDSAASLRRKVGFGTNDGSWRTSFSYYARRLLRTPGRGTESRDR